MLFSLEPYKFPTSPQSTVSKGEILHLTINIIKTGLESPVIYNLVKQKDLITLVDEYDNLYQTKCVIDSVTLNTRIRSGDYTFKAQVNTQDFPIGLIRVIGYVYSLIGEVIPVRQLHKII